MEIGLNGIRRSGLYALGDTLRRDHNKAIEACVEQSQNLGDYIGVKPIPPMEFNTALQLAVPVRATAAHHTASNIYSGLIEDHVDLSRDSSSKFFIRTLDNEYHANPNVGLIFARHVKVLRGAISAGIKDGQERVLRGLSTEEVPLNFISQFRQKSAEPYMDHIRDSVYGRLHMFPTSIIGVFFGITYQDNNPEYKVFCQDQFYVLESLKN